MFAWFEETADNANSDPEFVRFASGCLGIIM